MNMADKKDKKKDKEKEIEKEDDIFGEMDDVIGERETTESADAPQPIKKDISNPSHKKLVPEDLTSEEVKGEANSVNHVAEKYDINLPLKIDDKWYSYGLEEIAPELFIMWVHERLPGMKKQRPLKPEQCDSPQKRLDIFEEVIDVLARCFFTARKNRDKDILD